MKKNYGRIQKRKLTRNLENQYVKEDLYNQKDESLKRQAKTMIKEENKTNIKSINKISGRYQEKITNDMSEELKNDALIENKNKFIGQKLIPTKNTRQFYKQNPEINIGNIVSLDVRRDNNLVDFNEKKNSKQSNNEFPSSTNRKTNKNLRIRSSIIMPKIDKEKNEFNINVNTIEYYDDTQRRKRTAKNILDDYLIAPDKGNKAFPNKIIPFKLSKSPSLKNKEEAYSRGFYSWGKNFLIKENYDTNTFNIEVKDYDIKKIIVIQKWWKIKYLYFKLRILRQSIRIRVNVKRKLIQFINKTYRLYRIICFKKSFAKIKNLTFNHLPIINFIFITKERKYESKKFNNSIISVQNNYRLYKAIQKKNILYHNSGLKPTNHRINLTRSVMNNDLLDEKLNIIANRVKIFLNSKKQIIKKENMQYINEHGFYIDKVFLTPSIKEQKHCYQNLNNYKYIKKSDMNKLYFFTKKTSNEHNDIKTIKNIQRHLKIRFTSLKHTLSSKGKKSYPITNKLPISPKKGSFLEKIRVNSIIYNDYKDNYKRPNKFKPDIVLNKALLITKKRIRDNSNEILLIQKFYIFLVNFRKSEVIYLKPKDEINQDSINKGIHIFKSNEIRNSQKINHKIFSYKFVSFITKKNVIAVINQVINLQKKIKSFLLIKSKKNYYQNLNLNNYKFIKKNNLNKLYYFTKKISNEFNDIQTIKNIQKVFKTKYLKIKQNILYSQNNIDSYSTKTLENDADHIEVVVLEKVRSIELNFIGFEKKSNQIKNNTINSNQIISNQININQIDKNEIYKNQKNSKKLDSNFSNQNDLDIVNSNNIDSNQNNLQIYTNQNVINQINLNRMNSKSNKKRKITSCFIINETTFYPIIIQKEKSPENLETDGLNNERLRKRIENKPNSRKLGYKKKYVTINKKAKKNIKYTLLKRLTKNKKPINHKKGNFIDKIRVNSIIFNDYRNNYYNPTKFKIDIILNKSLLITKIRLKENIKKILQIQTAYKNYKKDINSFKIYRIPIIENYKILGLYVKEIDFNEVQNNEDSNIIKEVENESSMSSNIHIVSSAEESENSESMVIGEDKYRNRYPDIVGQKIISLYDKNEITNQPHINLNNYYFMSKFRIKSKVRDIVEDAEFTKIKARIEEKLNAKKDQNKNAEEILNSFTIKEKHDDHSFIFTDPLLNLDSSKSLENYKVERLSSQKLINSKKFTENILSKFKKKENDDISEENDKNKDQSKESFDEEGQPKIIIYIKTINKLDYYTKERHLNFKNEIGRLNKIKENEKNKFYTKPQNKICHLIKIRRLNFEYNLNKISRSNTNYKTSSESKEFSTKCTNIRRPKVIMKIKNTHKGKYSPEKEKISVPKKNIFFKNNIKSKITKNAIPTTLNKANNLISKTYTSYRNNINIKNRNKSYQKHPNLNNRKYYTQFLKLINLFINKNTHEYVYYLFFQKTNDRNITNSNYISKFPFYVTTLQRVLNYLQKEVYSCNKNILNFFFEIFRKQNILDNRSKSFYQIIASISKENEDALIYTSLFNKYDDNNQKEMIKFLCDFCKSDKMINNDKFINERIDQTLFDNTNIFTLVKFIDDEFNKLVQGDYCINCFNSIQHCMCKKYGNINETAGEFGSSLSLGMNDSSNLNEHIIINSFEYDNKNIKYSSIKYKFRKNNLYTDPNNPQNGNIFSINSNDNLLLHQFEINPVLKFVNNNTGCFNKRMDHPNK